MSELIIQSGKLQGKRLILPARDTVVGRDQDCDVQLSSSLVSRRHCVLRGTPDGVVVTDLNSQNGTFINDQPVTKPTLLREGDMLRIGAMVLAAPAVEKPKAAVDGNQNLISEADIADWLADQGVGSASAGGDTTVITPFSSTAGIGVGVATVSPPAAPAATAKPQAAKPKTVKDEAAEVIRKHWDAVKSKQKR